MPDSLRLFRLLERLHGYTAATLAAEDADLVEEWEEILNAEAVVSKEKHR